MNGALNLPTSCTRCAEFNLATAGFPPECSAIARGLKFAMMASMTTRSLLLTLLIVTLWGGNAVAVTYSVDWLPPVAVAAVRFALGTLVMIGWCLFERTPLQLSRRELKICLITAFLLFLQISTFNVGVLKTNSTHAILLINTYIFLVGLIEQFLLRETRLRALQWTGMLIAGLGVLCIVQVRAPDAARQPDAQQFLAGDSILLFSSLLLAARIVFVRHAVQSMPSSKLIFWHNLLSVFMFVAFSWATESIPNHSPPTSAILGLLYQGLVVAGLCFVIHASLLTRYSASQVSIYFFATPVCGVIFSVLLRGEPFNWLIAAGAACVAIGIWLSTRAPTHSTN